MSWIRLNLKKTFNSNLNNPFTISGEPYYSTASFGNRPGSLILMFVSLGLLGTIIKNPLLTALGQVNSNN